MFNLYIYLHYNENGVDIIIADVTKKLGHLVINPLHMTSQ